VNGELPDYAMITAAGTNAQAGGIAGRSENGAIIGDGELTNADNLVITGTTSAASSVLGGLIGTSDKTRLDQVFSGSVNLIVSSPGTTVGGMAGYNLGT
ncbi:hypothetical protein K0U00_51065, partial [Paenibacillus sepulcri]|nr:hypothetical protein [Paenibacillus sepulcri]